MTVFTLNKSLITLLFLFITSIVFGQHCGTDEYNKKFIDQNPEKYRQIEQRLQDRQNMFKVRGHNEVVIPVVFHVLWNDSIENLHDSILHRQLEVLNESFNLQNSDTSILTDTLKKWKGNFNIRFELAAKDPKGQPTNGITRTYTDAWSFSYWGNSIKSNLTGGKSPWNTHRYMNIWVGDLAGGLLGYSQFPGGPDSTDGNVIDFAVVGNTKYPWSYPGGNYTKGRVLVHEVGHWLNLFHPWGNNGGCSDDHIPETGRQASPVYPTFGCPDTLISTCPTQTPERIFVKHYMDYSGDACMVTFTKGQVERGLASLWSYRQAMIDSSELVLLPRDTFIEVKIYPNPTKRRLHLELPPYNGVLVVSIYDILGKLTDMWSLHGEESKELELNGYSNGTYILRIDDGNRQIFSKKFMIDMNSPWGSEIYIENQPIKIKNKIEKNGRINR